MPVPGREERRARRSGRCRPPGPSRPARLVRGRGRRPAAARWHRARAARVDPAASSGVVASTGTTASAPGGSFAPVAIRAALPGVTVTSGAAPAAMSPTTSSWTGCVLAGGQRVGGADRIAVHRGVGPGRERDAGRHGLGGDPTERVGRLDPFRADRLGDREDRVACRLDAEQAGLRSGWSRPGLRARSPAPRRVASSPIVAPVSRPRRPRRATPR